MKVTISRLFELSKYLATNSGKELEGALSYLSDFAELTIRGLRNGLTFEDNLNCERKRVTVRNGLETVVSVPSKKRPVRIMLDRAVSEYFVVLGFGWKFANSGDVIIVVKLDGNPPSTAQIDLDLTLFYG